MFSQSERIIRKENGNVMKSKKIYLVTALCFGYKYSNKKRSKDGIYHSYLKRTSPSQREYFTIINKRTFYWFSTLVDAQKCIKRNYYDMCEAVSFPEAVIEEVFEGGGVYDVPRKEWWYKWKGSYKKGGYKPWKKPKEYHNVVGFGIG